VKRALTALVERYALNEHQESQFAAVLGKLAEDESAPTTVREPAQALDVHLADSLVALELDAVNGGGGEAAATAGPAGSPRVLTDVGTGAGFPGLALAIALPGSEVVLLESQARKCAFAQRTCEAAEVENVRVVCTRAEEWGEGMGGSDVVLARALAPQPVVLEYAAPLLRLGGTLIDWRGRRDAEEESASAAAGEALGLRLVEIRHVEPYKGARNHHLHVYEKARETPARYPRRAGVARKRPLGC
jgi:16S rRNA (guanine527-N7)-methyltransferase